MRRALLCALVAAALVDGSLTPSAPAFEDDEDEPGFDSPDQAMEWVLLAQRDEQGNIPRDGLMKARAQMDALRRADLDDTQASGSAAPAVAGISRGTWTWIGPTNVGGRVRAIFVQPASPSTIVAGGVAGGMWKSNNGGASWRHIDDFMANLAISSIVARPGQTTRLFAGTGEGFFNADSIRGAGVFTSTDEGETWAQLPSTTTSDFDFVNRLAFSSDGNTLIAATRTGLFRSTDLGGSWSSVLGVANMLDVKFLAGSSQLAVAGGRNRNAYYSVNGGASWSIGGGLVFTNSAAIRVELAVSQSAANIVYASVDENSGQIWKSADGGVSYALVSTPAHLSTQGWYDNAIWIDPTDSNHLVVGGVSVSRSVNGGASFSGLSSCHADQHAILSDPGYNGSTNRRIYIGSDGGVCKMEDVTVNSVTSLRNGLGITQFYGAGGSAIAGRVMGGTQDNGTQIYDLTTGTAVWTTQFGSDGGYAAIDPTNGNNLYGEIQNFRIHRSLTGGTPSQYIYGGTGAQSCTKAVPFQITDACNGNANFIAPFMLDPNEPNRLLAGGRSLWRSDDVRTANSASTGPMWAAIKTPTAGNSNISAIAVAAGNSDIIWVGHNSGDVYVTLNGTAAAPTWVRNDGVLPNRTVTSIAIDPADPRVVYVSFGGFSPDSLWRTTNSGATWDDLTGSGGGGLPDVPVRWVVQHPMIRDWLYVATDVGVFASEDGGSNWHLPHDGPSNVAVFQLFWMDQTLVAVTHGRGLYTTVAASQFPAFSQRPRSQGILPGHVVAFKAVAVGAGPITYQWFRGQTGDTSNPIAGATSSGFTTPPIADTASYWVRATNPFGATDSNTATLTLLAWGTLLPGVSNQGGSNTDDAGATTTSVRSGTASAASSAITPVQSSAPATTGSAKPLVSFAAPPATAAPAGGSSGGTTRGSTGLPSFAMSANAPSVPPDASGPYTAASALTPSVAGWAPVASAASAAVPIATALAREVPFTTDNRAPDRFQPGDSESPRALERAQTFMSSDRRAYRSSRRTASGVDSTRAAPAVDAVSAIAMVPGAPASRAPFVIFALALPAVVTRVFLAIRARRR